MGKGPAFHRAAAIAALTCCVGCPVSVKTGPAAGPGTTTTTPAITKVPPAGLMITAPTVGGTLTLTSDTGLSLPVGITKQLTATELFSNGTSQDVTPQVEWKSSSTSVGTVSAAGVVAPVAEGNATVTATFGAFTQTFPLSVVPAIASIAIPTDLSALWVGGTQAIQVVATLSDMSTADVTGQATFSSSATSIATVSASGVVTGVAAGTATITATVSTFSATALATVLAVQPSIVSIAIGTDNNALTAPTLTLLPMGAQALGVWGTYSETGSVENVTSLATWTWSSSDTAVATVNADGVITALTAGTSTLRVTGLGFSATLSLTVTAPVQSIAIANLPASIGAGTYMFPDVLATLTDGTVVDVSPWATITSSGRRTVFVEGQAIIGNQMGSSTITATLGSATATATLKVIAVSSLQATPASLSIPVGCVDNWFAAFATLSDGSVMDVTGATQWTTDTPTVASFGAPSATQINSPLTALAVGSTSGIAQVGGLTAPIQVTVTPAVTVTSLSLTPAQSTLHIGELEAQPLTATATLSDDTMLDVTPFVTWGTGASVGGLVFLTDYDAGEYAAIAPAGTDTATATLAGSTATATVTVSPATITSIAVSPATVSVATGHSQSVSVTATYSDNTTADVTYLAVWTSTDTTGAVAVVSGAAPSTSGTPTSPTAILGVGTGTATLTAWVSAAGPYQGGQLQTSGSTTVTVQ